MDTLNHTMQRTDDGSNTLYLPDLDEHYHSTKGAYTESMHIFINSGLAQLHLPTVRVLEIGFGTGLNALLTLQYATYTSLPIEYTTIEKYPLPTDEVLALGYTHTHGLQDYLPQFEQMHRSEWNHPIRLTPTFNLLKIHTDLCDWIDRLHTDMEKTSEKRRFDIIYFDAFAPDKQPSVWKFSIFEQLYAHLSTGGILTTYCAKGVIRRMLTQIGFRVERLPGPPGGKREIIRATKPQ